MTDSKNESDERKRIALSLGYPNKAHSDALAQWARHKAQIDAVFSAVSKRLDLESAFLGPTASMFKHSSIMNIAPNIKSLLDANSNLAKVANQLSIPSSGLAKISAEHMGVQKLIQGLKLDDSVTSAFAKLDTTRILGTSLATQTKLANLDVLALGQIAGIDAIASKSITFNLASLTQSYSALIDIGAKQDSFAKFLPLITTFPPIECFRETHLLETFTIDDEAESQDEEDVESAMTEALPSIDMLLIDFAPHLMPLLDGARQALSSDNPDRARHATTSLRELFTHVLHALAPDQELEKWTSDDSHFHDNRPTRRARLLYICRDINCNPLEQFVESDVKAALSFINSLNAGTHVVKSKLTTLQLNALISRMESLLTFLLQIRNN